MLLSESATQQVPSIMTSQTCSTQLFSCGGESMKFRIQPGLSADLNTRLVNSITSNGGIIIDKMPVNGIVVVDPGSRKGKELLRGWAWSERPGRRFLSYALVLLCAEEQRIEIMNDHLLAPTMKENNHSKRVHTISADAHEELILHLAKKLPYSSSGNRSANGIYKDLVKNKARYPWIRSNTWQDLRNHYYKNKKQIDMLIRRLVQRTEKESSMKKPETTMKRPHKILGKENLENLARPTQPRKLRFARDLNLKLSKKPLWMRSTLDELLRAPSPPIIAGRKQRMAPKRKREYRRDVSHSDFDDVEIGRGDHAYSESQVQKAILVNSQPIHILPKRTEENITLELDSQLLDLSLAHYNLDLDDLRGAALLDSNQLQGEEADIADEKDVIALLGEPNVGTGLSVESIPSELQMLSQSLCFTVEEVKARYMLFENDLQVTREFFQQCRQVMDNYFDSYYKIYLGTKLGSSERTADIESLHEAIPVLNTSFDSFPAANTRTKTAARKLQVNSKA